MYIRRQADNGPTKRENNLLYRGEISDGITHIQVWGDIR